MKDNKLLNITENFTKVSNSMLESLAKLRISGGTLCVLLFIIRQTLGFQRISADMSVSFIKKATGLSRSTILRAQNELEELRIIGIAREEFKTNHIFLAIESRWILDPTLLKSSSKVDSNLVSAEQHKKDNKDKGKRVSRRKIREGVYISQEEEQNLLKHMSKPQFDLYADKLSYLIVHKGTKYTSHASLIMKWHKQDNPDPKKIDWDNLSDAECKKMIKAKQSLSDALEEHDLQRWARIHIS